MTKYNILLACYDTEDNLNYYMTSLNCFDIEEVLNYFHMDFTPHESTVSFDIVTISSLPIILPAKEAQ